MPIVAEVLKNAGKYDPKKLFGITTLDVVRASRFLSTVKSTDPADTIVTVVGGHSGVTIVPLLSQSEVGKALEQPSAEWTELVKRIQFGGDEVVKAKDGAGSATLSMAYGAHILPSGYARILTDDEIFEFEQRRPSSHTLCSAPLAVRRVSSPPRSSSRPSTRTRVSLSSRLTSSLGCVLSISCFAASGISFLSVLTQPFPHHSHVLVRIA